MTLSYQGDPRAAHCRHCGKQIHREGGTWRHSYGTQEQTHAASVEPNVKGRNDANAKA